MSEEPVAYAPQPEIDQSDDHTMLTTAIVGRFSEPVWMLAEKINRGAQIKVMPLTRAKLLHWGMKHKICVECGGRGLYRDFQGSLHSCPRCKGAVAKTWTDPDLRRFMIRELLHDARGLRGRDTTTGEVVDLPYSDDLRDALAETPVFDVVYELAIAAVGTTAERTEKN